MTDNEDLRRIKVIRIPAGEVFDMLIGGEYKNLIQSKALPKEYHVRDVIHDWRTGSFYFKIWSESFDIVPDGEEYPELCPVVYCLKEYYAPKKDEE